MPITLGNTSITNSGAITTFNNTGNETGIRFGGEGDQYYWELTRENVNTGYMSITSRSTGTPVERVRIHPSGQVTMPFQPAFHAVLNGPQTMVNNSDFVFGTAFLNRGSHYSTTTGRFTAPVTGVYFIYFEGLLQNNERDQIDIRFFINGNQSQVATMFQVDYGGSYRKVSMTAIVSLSTNDYIAVRTQAPNNYDFYGETNATILSNSGSGHTGFKGFLIG
jgi:hypothetical protein